MNKNFLQMAFAIVFLFLLVFSVQLYIGYTKLEAYSNAQDAYIEKLENAQSNEIQFIWNDTNESIPKDGSLILIEKTDENTVYIGNAN